MKQTIKTNLFDSAELLFQAIPRDLEANKEFRKTLHTLCAKDTGLQDAYLKLCLADYKIAFNSMFFTLNPRELPGRRNWPFILRQPKQEECIDTLKKCIEGEGDMGIDKSRDEGATEMVTKTFALLCLIPDSYFIVGSRSKDLVDNVGDPYTLMAKIRHAFDCMPNWLKTRLGPLDDKDMQLSVPSTNSVIRGETTNENFSAGRRATAMLLDEFGRVDPRSAEAIEGSVHDVTDTVIYCSTHWYGTTHTFNQVLHKNSTKRVILPWYENPDKRAGLYTSPDYNVIEIIDTEYYKEKYPDIKALHSPEPFKLSELENDLISEGYSGPSPRLIADKCENIPGDVRSPWHDGQEEKRSGSKRDFMSNIWMCPLGAQDSFFNTVTIDRASSKYCQKPTITGEIHLTYHEDGRLQSQSFQRNLGKNRLRWWGKLINDRPDQEHNYVIGCDISYGQGSSNSAACIYDSNLKEIVGTWVDPNTSVDDFADLVVGLARWCGGCSQEAFVIFEANGPGGIFGKRLIKQGHRRVYTQRSEEAKKAKKKNKWGWTSNPNAKEALLGDLALAISEGLRDKSVYWSCRIHDEDTYDELRRYVFFPGGSEIGISETLDESTGARKRHGDRVIATALCVLGSKYQTKAERPKTPSVSIDNFMKRRRELEAEQEAEKRLTTRKYRW